MVAVVEPTFLAALYNTITCRYGDSIEATLEHLFKTWLCKSSTTRAERNRNQKHEFLYHTSWWCNIQYKKWLHCFIRICSDTKSGNKFGLSDIFKKSDYAPKPKRLEPLLISLTHIGNMKTLLIDAQHDLLAIPIAGPTAGQVDNQEANTAYFSTNWSYIGAPHSYSWIPWFTLVIWQ